MKNEAGFSLLEIIITISLAGVVLAAMTKTIKTGLEIESFLEDKNAAVSWADSVLAAYKDGEINLADAATSKEQELVRQLEILEEESLPKDYEITKVEITPYQNDGVIYAGLYKIEIKVNFKCKNQEQQHQLVSLLKE